MDAIVLVGGLGTRLRPLTETRHKSLVPVCNRPAIEYLFDWLDGAGFERIVLALGRHNDDLADAYRSGWHGRARLLIVEEQERLESGGAIRHAVEHAGIDGRFAVVNGDVYLDFDFTDALGRHIERQADLTIALVAVDDPSSYGVAVVDGRGVITGFVEKPPPGTAPSNLVNAGAWIFERALVDEIPPGPVRVEETLFPSLVGRRRNVLGYEFHGLWADIGTPERYLWLNHELGRRHGGCVISATASIDASARVSASAIGHGSAVASAATIEDSVLWENAVVGPGAVVKASILADGVQVGAGARLVSVVAGSGASIAPGAEPPAAARLEPGERYG